LGWVPGSSTRETAYDHLNATIADEHKYALHVLLVEHGKRCRQCSKGGRLQKEVEGECPFKNWAVTVQEYASSSSSTEETSNRIEKVTIKEEKIVFETPTAFYRNEKRKEEDDASSSNEKAVKRLRHWDLQNASYVANESKQ
jgi:hypothetical protein